MATKKKAAKEVKKGPRQQRLPEMEDSVIQSIEDKALEYAEVRDERMGLSRQEVELKGQLRDLMKANNKKAYHHGPISIDITYEQEKIKVKIKNAADDEEGEDGEE